MVDLSSSATLGDLRGAIEVQLDVPSKYLQLAVGESLLPSDASMMLETAGIEADTRVSAIVRQHPLLPKLPNVFELKLNSSRMRLGMHRNSSAFTMIYTLKVDIPKSHVCSSLMRKNDTDHFEFDGQKGCSKGSHGHWMAGTTELQEHSIPCFELKEVLCGWMDRMEVIFDKEKQLWAMPSEGRNKAERETQTLTTKVADKDGWFVAPTPDCFELYVNAPFPVSGKCSSLYVSRILIDASGFPIRAALYHLDEVRNIGPKEPREHIEKADVDDMARHGNTALEEYDVALSF
eukprot:gnl/MRDRNA2_/MRDRNA2_105761_c0_seq1.p1 gnl/MRDRNA2_/MRDRNA2_105761_c0~~gnl/MRDRNA2_/MRDRNA2_105761_c0_seq1.p1  ORF type:complete len:326 (+),score=56.14 gnl/MRDRNA2_/MRDRNA2_105761_c0_seq1:108-980(+)